MEDEDKREVVYELEQVSNGYIMRDLTECRVCVVEFNYSKGMEPVRKLVGDMIFNEVDAHMNDMETCKVKLTLTIENIG